MKRFTETGKWEDKWFRGLSPAHKLIYLYLLDVCDQAGFWEIDIEGAAFQTKLSGDKISPIFEGLNKSQEGLSKALMRKGDYVWIKDFLADQNNLPLNPLNNAHKKAINCITYRSEFEEAELLLPDDEIGERARVCQKEAVWVRDGGICLYCREVIKEEKDYELDHIVPRASHVSEIYTNFATSCLPCNRRKAHHHVDLTVEDFSSAQAKKTLREDPALLLKFNEFFSRRLRVHGNSLIELAPHKGASISPIGIGNGRGSGKGNGKILKPTREEIAEYAISRELTPNDAEWLWEKWEGNGFKNGGKPIKNWKATINQWQAQSDIFPSQKSKSPNRSAQPQFKGLQEDIDLP